MRLTLKTVSALLACATSLVHAGEIGLKNAKVTVTTTDGTGDASYTLKEPEPLPSPIWLTAHSTLKLSFNLVDTSSSTVPTLSQSTILFEDAHGDSTRDVYLPLNIKSTGSKLSGSFVLNSAKPPAQLVASGHGEYKAYLLLSSLDKGVGPLFYPLGEIALAQETLKAPIRGRHDLPPREGEPAFQAQQELFHTFRADEGTVGVVKTGLGMVLVLGPWAVLLLLIGNVSPSLRWHSPPTTAVFFLVTLAALEGLIFVYWVGLKLYQFLPYFLGLAAISAYSCKLALVSLRQRRIKA